MDEPTEPAPAEDARGRAARTRKPGPCELCGRPGQPLTFHHLIPRHCHRKARFLKRFSLQEMRRRGLWLCGACHGGIHDLLPDEKELGWSYNTRESLLAHEGVRKHVEWVRKLK
jgi:hypothetical protein